MKTTIEVPDQLAKQIKAYAAERGLSMREVHERALRALLTASKASSSGFRLKMITTDGEGLQVPGGWSSIRSMIYPDGVE